MNKRTIKKGILYSCGEIVSEAAFAATVLELKDPEAMSAVIVDAARLQVNSIKKVSVSFDRQPKDFANHAEYRKARRAYYRKAFKALTENFNNELLEIIKKMNAALPAAE